MASTYYFIEEPGQQSAVLGWLREHAHPSGEVSKDGGVLLSVGGESAVSVFTPRVERTALWTVGEAHFLATKTSTNYKETEALRRRFDGWLRTQKKVFDQTDREGEHAYFFEGSLKNIAPVIFALPSGLEAIESGRYFVADGDNELVLDAVCRSLRLRGVHCN